MKYAIGIACLLLTASFTHATTTEYEVTITNITRGQFFTPQLLVTHNRRVSTFELGEAASLAMETLAEGGDTAPLTEQLLSKPHRIADVLTIAGLLGPGQSVTTTIEGSNFHRFLSLAAMLIPTNDTFVALNGVELPRRGKRSYLAVAYDAGTEANDQDCSFASVPAS